MMLFLLCELSCDLVVCIRPSGGFDTNLKGMVKIREREREKERGIC